ncbi:TatD family hydrolase [Marinobacter sp.]|uniref:TatD family hydrolase n=1 Tax=Marinobacter sp. TaxID=50741 RepID=UPI002B267869|nr:TatD family hydrolase [Marinobacter sp.]
MRFFDAHCHFDFPEFDGRREQELASAKAGGVQGLVMPGVRRSDWARLVSLSAPEAGLWYCLGIHPWFVAEHGLDDLDALEAAVASRLPGCIGVGECGLDGLRGSFVEQAPWFSAQVGIAARFGAPLVIHSVKAHDQVAALLRSERWQGRALIHGFSGSYQQACKFIELGCYIGVGGVITHDRAKKTRDVISRLPVEVLVLETDAPDMSPAGVAKGQNSPLYIPDIFAQLAGLRGDDKEWLAEVLMANVGEFYGLAPEVLAPN